MVAFPNSFQLLGAKWRARIVSADHRALRRKWAGHCDPEKHAIFVSRDCDDTARAEVLLHEILHPILCASGLELTDERPEDEHDRLTAQLFAWLRDERNRDVIDYIMGRR